MELIIKLSKYMDYDTKNRAIFILAQIKKNNLKFNYIKYNNKFNSIINKSYYNPNIISIDKYSLIKKKSFYKDNPYSYKVFFHFKN